MIRMSKTMGVKEQFLQDIDRILYWTTIIVQLIFFGYYGYSIYNSLSNTTFLIIYSLLLVLSTITFIHYLQSYGQKIKKTVKVFKKTFRIFKYVINGSMIALNIIGIVRYGGNDLSYILIALSCVSLLIQIIIEFVRGFVSRYIELFYTAIVRDNEWAIETYNKLGNLTNFKGHALGAINVPLELIVSDKTKNNVELTKDEKHVDELEAKYKEKLALRKQNKKEEKKKEKVTRYKRIQDRKKSELKKNLGLFKEKYLTRKKRKK